MRVTVKPSLEEVMEFLTRDFSEDDKTGYRSRLRQLLPDCNNLGSVEQKWQLHVVQDQITERKRSFGVRQARDKEMISDIRSKQVPTIKDGFAPYYLFPHDGPPYDHVFTPELHKSVMNNVIYKRWADKLLELLRETV